MLYVIKEYVKYGESTEAVYSAITGGTVMVFVTGIKWP